MEGKWKKDLYTICSLYLSDKTRITRSSMQRQSITQKEFGPAVNTTTRTANGKVADNSGKSLAPSKLSNLARLAIFWYYTDVSSSYIMICGVVCLLYVIVMGSTTLKLILDYARGNPATI